MPTPRTHRRPSPSSRAAAFTTVLVVAFLAACGTDPRDVGAATARPDPAPSTVAQAPADAPRALPPALKNPAETAAPDTAAEPDEPEPPASSPFVAGRSNELSTPPAFDDPDVDLTTDAVAAHELLAHFLDAWTLALQTGNRSAFLRTFSPACSNCAAIAADITPPPPFATVTGAAFRITPPVQGNIVETGEKGWAFSFEQDPLLISSDPAALHIEPGLAGGGFVKFGWDGDSWLVDRLGIQLR
ncbi:hypothetical protein ACTVCO_01770 [Sanguibacter sp. A247]|uniref:hypothetical protein n=1 Tax=unclassified Sanguibacter TaxID=2645534 RepID=UPI003FD7C923